MFANPAASWYHSPRYNAETGCEHCGGIVRHERWCITRDPLVRYAYEVVQEPDRLSFADRLALHGMGVSWKRDT